MLRDSAATVFTMHDVERLGIARVTELLLLLLLLLPSLLLPPPPLLLLLTTR
jgi:hypothetical protein